MSGPGFIYQKVFADVVRRMLEGEAEITVNKRDLFNAGTSEEWVEHLSRYFIFSFELYDYELVREDKEGFTICNISKKHSR